MKQTKLLLLTLLLLCVAATTIDQFDADFNTGTNSNTNVSNNSVLLSGTSGNYSLSGTYTSSVNDLGSNPTASISWTASAPAGTSILVSSRSGNISSPDGTWSSWSSSYTDNTGSSIAGEDRYHQYRLQLATTDQNETPAIQAVTLTYTEQGPTVAAATNQNAALNDQTTGAYRFFITATDTVSLNSQQARYRIGNDSYSAYQAMTLSGGNYYIDIPSPAPNWSMRSAEILTIQTQINNSNGYAANNTFADLIDAINDAPVLATISNTTGTERVELTISLSATDPDGDNLTFTSSYGSTTSTGSNTADLVWTPANNETGYLPITITVSDGLLADNQVFYVNVTAVNDPPVMQAITDQTGHYGDEIIFTIIVDDNDTNDNLTFWTVPDLFDIELVNSTGTVYNAEARFIALDDHEGNTTIEFFVQDTENTSSQNATLSVTYCGDAVCQSVENATSCSNDCEEQEVESLIALEIPDRLCTNQTMVIQAYNASTRYDCFEDKRTFEYQAYCEEQEGIDLQIYRFNGSLRIDAGSISTNSSGHASFITLIPGKYKIIASSDELRSTEQIITVRDCTEDINIVEEVVEYARPQIEVDERRVEISPDLERPDITPEETSLLAIIIWWIVIPLMSAMLLFTGNIYYAQYKDTNPQLLALRIKMWEYRSKLEPILMPYLQKIWQLTSPVLVPVGTLLWKYGGKQAWQKILPLLKKLDKRPPQQ